MSLQLCAASVRGWRIISEEKLRLLLLSLSLCARETLPWLSQVHVDGVDPKSNDVCGLALSSALNPRFCFMILPSFSALYPSVFTHICTSWLRKERGRGSGSNFDGNKVNDGKWVIVHQAARDHALMGKKSRVPSSFGSPPPAIF